MAIAFTADNYYLGVYFVGHNDATPVEDRIDWMGTVFRPAYAPGAWEFVYRFRYHASPDPFSNDRKSWYQCTVPADTAVTELLAKVRLLMTVLATEWQGLPDEVPLECTGDRAIDLLLAAKKAWLHFQELPGTEEVPHAADH